MTTKAMDFPSSLVIKEALLHYFKHPVVFKSYGKSWTPIPWTTEQLSNQYGNILLDFRIVSKSEDGISWEGSAKYVQAKISHFIEWQEANNSTVTNTNPFHPYKVQDFWGYSSYNYMSHVFHKDADILKAVNWTAFGYPETSGKDTAFWIGSDGSYTPCHFDTYGFNLVAQIQGRKKWTLFPPEDTLFMYPTRIPYEESSVFSSVNIVNPDLKLHPLFKCVHPHVVILEPGDVLYVPNKWWHFVQSLDLTVSINTWISSDNNGTHLEEAVTRALMSSFISFFEPVGESWINPNEELVLPEETLGYVLQELEKIKSTPQENIFEKSSSNSSITKTSDRMLESDTHSNILEGQIQSLISCENIKVVSPDVFSDWYGKIPAENSADSSQNINAKKIIDCFVHPEVISVICKLLKNL